jgi:hypothetical protein
VVEKTEDGIDIISRRRIGTVDAGMIHASVGIARDAPRDEMSRTEAKCSIALHTEG